MLYGEDLIARRPIISPRVKGGPTVHDRRYDNISDVGICIHGLHSLVSLLFLCSQEAFVASRHSACKLHIRVGFLVYSFGGRARDRI